MTKVKLNKEEKEARKQQQIRQLWQSAGIAGVESLGQEIYAAILRKRAKH